MFVTTINHLIFNSRVVALSANLEFMLKSFSFLLENKNQRTRLELLLNVIYLQILFEFFFKNPHTQGILMNKFGRFNDKLFCTVDVSFNLKQDIDLTTINIRLKYEYLCIVLYWVFYIHLL